MKLISFTKRKINAVIIYWKILLDKVNIIFFSNNYFKSIQKYIAFKKVLLLQTPEHFNIGDHAIAFAEQIFLNDVLENLPVIEFSFNDIKYRFRHIKKIINRDDLIILPGGGNFGNLYPSEEKQRKKVLKALQYNKIVIMPQSINYSNTASGRRMLKDAQRITNRCSQLTICCRDFQSFNYAKENFKCSIQACPDIVHYLQNYFDKYKTQSRKDVLLVFRNDKEKYISSKLENEIKEYIMIQGYNTISLDTLGSSSAIKENRKYVIGNLIRKFYEAKLIITDRFHGMVFSVITETPCIVLKSIDHKIESGYQWYPENSNITYIGDNKFELLKTAIDKTMQGGDEKFISEKERVSSIIYSVIKEWI